MASQVVGTAFVRLRLLTDTIGKDIKQSIEKADLQDIDIRVDADTAEAMAKLGLLDREADALDGREPQIKPRVDAKTATKEIGALRTAIGLLGPTIGPLGGAITAALGGVAAGAGVAVLAVLGVKKELKAATETGVAFQSGIQVLKRDLAGLEATAAKAVLPGFQSTVATLNSIMPQVNRSVAVLGRELGDITSHVIVGLVAGLRTFEPLLLHVGQSADIAARHFEEWATGPGGAGFAQTLGHSFDTVIPVLVDLTEAVARLVSAFAPIGEQILGLIGALSAAINAIPLPVLQGLASVFIALFAASKLNAIFSNLSLSLVKMSATAGVASVKLGTLGVSLAGLTKFAGGAAAAGFAVFSLGQSINSFLEKGSAASKVLDSYTQANADFYNALIQSKGALDDTVRSSVQYQLTQDKLTEKAARAGISQDQLTDAITGTDEQTSKLIETWKRSGKPSSDTLFALKVLHENYQDASEAAAKYNAEQLKIINTPVWEALKTTKDSTQQVADKYGLAADSVKSYAALVGITDTAIKNGVVTNKQLAESVQEVTVAYASADAAGSQFLDALQKFSTSAGTAADRAQLIGSFLKAAQGDALGFAGAMSSAFTATQNLINGFNEQQKASIDLRTGLIDVTKAGAGPLIQSLQQMQNAAEQAAVATYQHEVAERGAGRAASDAATVFRTQTYTALVNNAKQLGLTKDQATRLANQYFAMPKDIATRVRTIGTDPVVRVLNQIGKQLSFLTHIPWTAEVRAQTDRASANIEALRRQLDSLNGRVSTVVINSINKRIALEGVATGGLIGSGGVKRMASGGLSGLVKGPGTARSDTAGLFALSNGEYVINANATRRYLPLLQSINAQGMASGGAVTAPGGAQPDWAAFAAAVAAEFRNARFELVATNGGTALAKLVNDANLVNGRRLGQ